MKKIKSFITKRSSVFAFLISFFFVVYMAGVVLLSMTVSTPVLIESISKNKPLLIVSFIILVIILFLVLYNLGQVIVDRIKNKEGSRLRFRLTMYFLLVAVIPIIPLSVVSNNLISKSINLWFLSGIENSLLDAIKVSKELYNSMIEESKREFFSKYSSVEEFLGDLKSVKGFKKIDYIYFYDSRNKLIRVIYSKSGGKRLTLKEGDVKSLINKEWIKKTISGKDYLLSSVNTESGLLVVVRKVPDRIYGYTSSISKGLQRYRTLKIIRKPIKGMILLFYFVITLPFLLLSFYLSLFISKEITNPIKELVIATEKVAANKLDYKVDIESRDELKVLIDSFNSMINELRINRELIKYSERSTAWQDIARKLAHEIKNPLTPIKLSAERILKQYKKDDDYKKILNKGISTIIDEVNNINEMVSEFSSFARLPSTKMEKINIVEVTGQIVSFVSNSYKDIVFNYNYDSRDIYLFVDKNQLRRAILNIIYNSINAVEENGVIDIRIGFKDKDKNRVIISITDNGIGIDEDIKDKIFNPYFSKNGKGSGLGLAIVEKIIYDNKGRIWFESEPGKTTFYMEFDRA